VLTCVNVHAYAHVASVRIGIDCIDSVTESIQSMV